MKEYRDSVRRWCTIADRRTVVDEEKMRAMMTTMEAIVEDLRLLNIITDIEAGRKDKEKYPYINWAASIYWYDLKSGLRLSEQNILDRERAMRVARIERNKDWLRKNMP